MRILFTVGSRTELLQAHHEVGFLPGDLVDKEAVESTLNKPREMFFVGYGQRRYTQFGDCGVYLGDSTGPHYVEPFNPGSGRYRGGRVYDAARNFAVHTVAEFYAGEFLPLDTLIK